MILNYFDIIFNGFQWSLMSFKNLLLIFNCFEEFYVMFIHFHKFLMNVIEFLPILSNAQQSCVPAFALGVWLFVNRLRTESIAF